MDDTVLIIEGVTVMRDEIAAFRAMPGNEHRSCSDFVFDAINHALREVGETPLHPDDHFGVEVPVIKMAAAGEIETARRVALHFTNRHGAHRKLPRLVNHKGGFGAARVIECVDAYLAYLQPGISRTLH